MRCFTLSPSRVLGTSACRSRGTVANVLLAPDRLAKSTLERRLHVSYLPATSHTTPRTYIADRVHTYRSTYTTVSCEELVATIRSSRNCNKNTQKARQATGESLGLRYGRLPSQPVPRLECSISTKSNGEPKHIHSRNPRIWLWAGILRCTAVATSAAAVGSITWSTYSAGEMGFAWSIVCRLSKHDHQRAPLLTVKHRRSISLSSCRLNRRS